jgi:hypothetical protein
MMVSFFFLSSFYSTSLICFYRRPPPTHERDVNFVRVDDGIGRNQTANNTAALTCNYNARFLPLTYKLHGEKY